MVRPRAAVNTVRRVLAGTNILSAVDWTAVKNSGGAIVRSMTSQCPGATFCWIANGLAVQALREMEGVRVLRHASFGGVELVVATHKDADALGVLVCAHCECRANECRAAGDGGT